jgi:hypothetical protein
MKDDRYNHHSENLLKNLGLVLTGGVALLTLVIVAGVWQMGDRFFTALTNFFNASPPAPKVDVQSIVLQQVREASELTTAVYTMQAVVPTSQDAALGGVVVGTTKLLYIAHGEVQAGVDLGKLTGTNLQVSGNTVRVRLPAPQILNSKIDVNRSNVYDYNRGFLGLGPDTAPELQMLAQRKALQTVVTAACGDGILQRANDRAKFVVTSLLTTAGFEAVNVEVQAPTAAACQPTQETDKKSSK